MTDTSCPVCGRGLTGNPCAACGFDRSLYAEQYPSLFRDPGGKLRPVSVLRREYQEKTAPKAEPKPPEDPELLFRQAMKSTDELEKVELLSRASFQGHAPSQTALGMLYRRQGNMKLAADLFQKAAVGKNGEACFQLSHCYRDGLGVKTSASSAIHWLRRAAELGQVKAVLELADAFLVGGDVTKDPDEAEKYYQKAAKMGSPEGLVHLAWCYRDGKYVPRSRAKARELLNQASKYGSKEAKALLLSPEFQLAETKARAAAGNAQTQTKAGTTSGTSQTKAGATSGASQTKKGPSAGTAQTKAGATSGSAQTKTGATAGSAQTKTGPTAGSAQTKTGPSTGAAQTKTGPTTGTAQTKAGATAGAARTRSSREKREKVLEGKTLKQLKFGRIWRGILFYVLAPSVLIGIITELGENWIPLRDLIDMLIAAGFCWVLGRSYFLYRSVYRKRTGQAGTTVRAAKAPGYWEKREKTLEGKSLKQLIFGISWRVVLSAGCLAVLTECAMSIVDADGTTGSDLLIPAVFAALCWLLIRSFFLCRSVYRKQFKLAEKTAVDEQSRKALRAGMVCWGILFFIAAVLLISLVSGGFRASPLTWKELPDLAFLLTMCVLFGENFFYERSGYKKLTGQAGKK